MSGSLLMLLENLPYTLQKYSLIPPETTVIVAVSGGTDSLALLHALVSLQRDFQFRVHVATLNHGLRAGAADEIRSVEQVAADLGVPVTSGVQDVAQIAQEHGLSLETAARQVRYDFLAQVARQQETDVIATGHHADDNAESILMHLIRGSGLQGLRGMTMRAPVPGHPDLTLFRPLLTVTRADLVAYCQQQGLSPREDESNADTRFRRNYIRHEILPRLTALNPQVHDALNRLGAVVGTEQDFLQEQYRQQCYPHIQITPGRIVIPREQFRTWHLALQRYSLRTALQTIGGMTDVSLDHIQTLIEKARAGQVGDIVALPGTVRGRCGYDDFYIEQADAPLPDDDYLLLEDGQEITFSLPRTIVLHQGTLRLRSISDTEDTIRLFAPAEATFQLRSRLPGDRFQPAGMEGHSKSLKKWFIDEKIPRHLRSRIPLLVIDGVIAAIILPDRCRIAQPFVEEATAKSVIYLDVTKN